jgi:sec-independent protein translocase protein TatC
MGFLIAYCFKERLFNLLTAPLVKAMGPGTKIIFTGLPEAFFTYLKTALLVGILLAAPYLFHQFWMFVSPGFFREKKTPILPIVGLSVVFFIMGACFGYFFVFPFGFTFFLGFSTETIQAMPTMKEYLGFASTMLLSFGLIFELPLVLAFLSKMGLVSVGFLKKNRKYAVLLAFIIGAILTPPDVITQIMMAVPLLILYEIGIWGAALFSKKTDDQADGDDASDGIPAQEKTDPQDH